MDREQEDTQRRIGELQLDLVDLRDAHAKMRSQNDRLRRERNAYEKEREDWRLKLFAALDVQNKVVDVIAGVDEMEKLLPAEPEKKEEPKEASNGKPAEGAKKKKKAATPGVNVDEMRKTVEKVKEKARELQQVSMPIRDEDRVRRATSFRRAVSASEMAGQTPARAPSIREQGLPTPLGGALNVVRAPPRLKGRKSLSLDQQIQQSSGASQERIWESADSANTTPTSSVSNLRGGAFYRGFTGYTGYESESSLERYRWAREGSYGDSDVSAPAGGVAKPKKSLKEKFLPKSSDDTSKMAQVGLNPLALHGLDVSPLELAKQRQKKESSLKYRLSKTLSKTFSRSSSALQSDPSLNQMPDRRPQFLYTPTGRPMSALGPPGHLQLPSITEVSYFFYFKIEILKTS